MSKKHDSFFEMSQRVLMSKIRKKLSKDFGHWDAVRNEGFAEQTLDAVKIIELAENITGCKHVTLDELLKKLDEKSKEK